ncbi:MAG: ABC transporter ATP-binding protein [Pseudomonadota bacterium]
MSHQQPPALALSVANVSHSFGSKKVLVDVSLNVHNGKICGLLGLNGAGKTTLLSLITRLYDNTSGSISVNGFDVRKDPMVALNQLGVVFQNRSLDLELSIRQNLQYHASLYGISKSVANDRIELELDRAGLLERSKDKVRTLSGGQVRRVEIARSLIHQPRLLLLDEPTVGLDVAARQELIKHVRGLVSDEKIGVLWTTHLFDEIMDEDDAVVLHQGKVLATGTHGDILKMGKAKDLTSAFQNITKSGAAQELAP